MEIKIRISEKVNNELRHNHFCYGVLNVSNGLEFLTSEEQLKKKS